MAKKREGKGIQETTASRALTPAAEEFASESEGMGRDLAISGKRVAKVFEVATRVLTPEFWHQNWSQLKTVFVPRFKKRLDDIPEKRLQDPPLQLAAPLIEHAAIAQDEPEIVDVCAKLLASAMDTETASKAHPALAQIVRALSAVDIRILKYMQQTHRHIPLYEVNRNIIDTTTFSQTYKNITNLPKELGLLSELTVYSIDNLIRLGLTEIPVNIHLKEDNIYNTLGKSDWYLKILRDIESGGRYKAETTEHLLRFTNFGYLFCEVALPD